MAGGIPAALGAAAITLWAQTASVSRTGLEAAGWPEQVGRGNPAEVVRELDALEDVIDDAAAGEFALGARYRRALLKLEPTPAHDAEEARAELVALAELRSPPWEARARHALAWIRERDGDVERAREGYRRVVADHGGSDAAARSKAGLGRLLLLAGQPAEAAALLDEAIAEGAPAETGAVAAREAAVRALLRPSSPLEGVRRALSVPLEDVTAVGVSRDGLYLADRRAGQVVQLSFGGTVVDTWQWPAPVDAVAVDAAGRVAAAVDGTIWRLEPGGTAVETWQLGEFEPPGALALGAGGAWVIDKRGQRLGRVEPGGLVPTLLVEDRERRIVALAWDGERLLGLDGRDGTVRSLWTADGGTQSIPISVSGAARPGSLAIDPTGRWLVIDGRSGVRLFDREGRLLADLQAAVLGVERLVGAVLGADGALHVVDSRGPAWQSWP